MGEIGWSDLPEELVDLIANRVSSKIDLLRIRSTCKPWRSASAVASKKRFMNRFQRNFGTLRQKTLLYPLTFFRVTHPSSSSPNKGWLIKTSQIRESSKNNLLFPLSRQLISPYNQTLDLLKLGISEIQQSYKIYKSYSSSVNDRISYWSRVVLVDNLVFKIDYFNQLWFCKSGEECSSRWKRIENREFELYFSDIIVHKGQVYLLGLKGAIWWIRLYDLIIIQYTPSTPDGIYVGKYKRLVEYCGDLCIVHRFCKELCVEGVYVVERTVKFKVYKIDEEFGRWVEVSSLGDKALIVAPDSCFTVLASEYYGCLENAIYFTDDNGDKFKNKMKDARVFKLQDGSIINMIGSSSQSCFQMFFDLPFS